MEITKDSDERTPSSRKGLQSREENKPRDLDGTSAPGLSGKEGTPWFISLEFGFPLHHYFSPLVPPTHGTPSELRDCPESLLISLVPRVSLCARAFVSVCTAAPERVYGGQRTTSGKSSPLCGSQGSRSPTELSYQQPMGKFIP